MKMAPYNYILKIVQETNILPVTSSCTTGCIFCSHKNNPEGIEVFALPKLSFEEIVNMSEFLNKAKKIVIGESASRIIEGEPFLREDMMDILRFLRKKYPCTQIEITTSGTFLTQEVIEELAALNPVELNISLNSSTVEGRKLLHFGKDAQSAIKAVEYLKDSGIVFHGSIVAMPDIVGYEDIKNTIAYLCENNARTVRAFVPGFSGKSDFKIDFFEVRQRLREISDLMYGLYSVPVLIEPPVINDLEPEVCGTMKGSPACESGILKGDIIMKVNNYEPLTRVDAYNALCKNANPKVQLKRDESLLSIIIKKKPGVSPGAVFYYDINPDDVFDIGRAISKAKSENPLVITSELGYEIVKLGIEKLLNVNIDIWGIHNNWFGGTIMCTGLLTVPDMINGIKSRIEQKKPDLIIIPSLPFDINGKDLSGHYFSEIENAFGIKTVVIG